MGWLTGWRARAQITVHASQVVEDIGDFRMYLGGDGFPAGYWQGLGFSDGRDVRFTEGDGETQ